MQKVKWLSVIFVSVLIIAVSFSNWLPNLAQPEQEALDFERSFLEQKAALDQELKVFVKDFLEFPTKAKKWEGELENKQANFFVLRQKEVLFWEEDITPFDQRFFNYHDTVVFTGNSWQYLHQIEQGPYHFFALLPLKYDYEYENKFLLDHFFKAFDYPNLIGPVPIETANFKVKGKNGKVYLGLKYAAEAQLSSATLFWAHLLELLAFILFFWALLKRFPLNSFISFSLHFAVLLGFRVLLFFQLPYGWQKWSIFKPSQFALHQWIPSLGDFLLHSVAIFYLVYIWKKFSQNQKTIFGEILELLAAFLLFFGVQQLIVQAVMNSAIEFNLNNLVELNSASYISLLAFAMGFFSTAMLLQSAILKLKANVSIQAIFHRFWGAVLLLFLFSASSAYTISSTRALKQKQQMQYILQKLAEEKDPVAEYLFEEIQQGILKDDALKELLVSKEAKAELLKKYVKEVYFNGYWSKYNIIITPCKANDSLYLSTGDYYTPCNDYFMNLLKREGELISSTNLFQLQNFPGRIEYLAEINLSVKGELYSLYMELSSNMLSEGQGYPELLLDEQSKADDLDLSDYSYAIYEKGKLIYHNGGYTYARQLGQQLATVSNFKTFEQEQFEHMLYAKNAETKLVLSREQKSWFDWLTSWTYVFVLFALAYGFLALTHVQFPHHFKLQLADYSLKVQLFLVGALFIALIAFSVGTYYYIQNQYQQKNFKNLKEKVRSINMELEQAIGTEELLAEPLQAYISGQLIKLSNVFYTDINLYDTNGMLYATSRPEIFDQQLKSRRMNPIAFQALDQEKKAEWVQKEEIGKMEYLSAYIPFRNYNNEVLAYLNLPYFAKQDEFQQELSSFLASTLNIYIAIFTFALLLSVLVVNQLSRPLRLIREKISALTLGSSVNLIEWESQDEIGALVKEYNRVVLELNESAERLAQQEREGAWREMAKQVAHEIKNPLTPMKLSIQHLQRTVKQKPEDSQDRLDQTAKTLIQQIDTLSSIANAFSAFAKLPEKNFQQVELKPILETATNLYLHEAQIKLEAAVGLEEAKVFGDSDQLLRLFNNLLKNAVHAIQDKPDGQIKVSLSEDEKCYVVTILDNGIGIPKEQQERIFEPNFTTKSSGTGLGLAMAKSIVTQMEGEIDFTSEVGKGTRFQLRLMKLE